MSRSLLSSLVLSCILVGCPGTTDKPVEGETGDTYVEGIGDEDGDGWTESEGDCDEGDPLVNPDAEEICDGTDNNCNGEIDENGETLYYLDADDDGFGDESMSVMACEPDDGYVANSDDCDDSESTVYPGADEVCDGLDNDCNDIVDDDLTTTWYRDADGDGYGDEEWTVDECENPGTGWVSSGGDCDDSEPMAWTGAEEICDGIDNDCDGTVDNGLSTVWYPDADGDGYGDEDGAIDSCTDPGSPYIATGGDCDDTEELAWTGASEYCDEVDNDCNGAVDDDALDAIAVTADDDGDGFGSATDVTYACEEIVDNTLDCDDADANEPQTVSSTGGADWTSIQDGIDAASMCVAVSAGTYYENIDFDGKDVDVFSIAGWATTIIDGGGAGSVVSFQNGESAAAMLRGFTVQNGGGTLESTVEYDTDDSSVTYVTTYNRYYGGGVIIDGATPTLSELWVTGSNLPVYDYTETSSTSYEYTYSYGGGVFVSNSSGATIDSVTIDWNYADEGGGLYASDSASLEATATDISYNSASNGGGYTVAGGTFDLTNGLVIDNDATAGGGAWIDGGSSTWWNVTAAGNSASTGAGVAITDSGAFELYSSVISDSGTGDGVYGDGTASFTASYSDVYGSDGSDFSGVTDPTGTSGNISSNPLFTDWTDDNTDNDDFAPDSSSPLTNAGNPSAAYNDTDGTRNDIGAYGGPGGSW